MGGSAYIPPTVLARPAGDQRWGAALEDHTLWPHFSEKTLESLTLIQVNAASASGAAPPPSTTRLTWAGSLFRNFCQPVSDLHPSSQGGPLAVVPLGRMPLVELTRTHRHIPHINMHYREIPIVFYSRKCSKVREVKISVKLFGEGLLEGKCLTNYSKGIFFLSFF